MLGHKAARGHEVYERAQQAQHTWVQGTLNDGASSDDSDAASIDSAMRDYLACCSSSEDDAAGNGAVAAVSSHQFLHDAWRKRNMDAPLSGVSTLALHAVCTTCWLLTLRNRLLQIVCDMVAAGLCAKAHLGAHAFTNMRKVDTRRAFSRHTCRANVFASVIECISCVDNNCIRFCTDGEEVLDQAHAAPPAPAFAQQGSNSAQGHAGHAHLSQGKTVPGVHLDLALFTQQPKSKKHARRLAIKGKRTMRAVGPSFDPQAIAQLLQHLCEDPAAVNPQRIRLVASSAPKQAQCKEIIAWAGRAAGACGLHGSLITSRKKPAGLFLEVERRGPAQPLSQQAAHRLHHMVQTAVQAPTIHKHAHAAGAKGKQQQQQQQPVATQLRLKQAGKHALPPDAEGVAFVSAGFIDDKQLPADEDSAHWYTGSLGSEPAVNGLLTDAHASHQANQDDAPKLPGTHQHPSSTTEGCDVMFDAWEGPALGASAQPWTSHQHSPHHAPIRVVTNTVTVASAVTSTMARGGEIAVAPAALPAHAPAQPSLQPATTAAPGSSQAAAHEGAAGSNALPGRPVSASAHAMSALAISSPQQPQTAAERGCTQCAPQAADLQLPVCQSGGAPVHPQEVVSLMSDSDDGRPECAGLSGDRAGHNGAQAQAHEMHDDVQIVGHVPASQLSHGAIDVEAVMSAGGAPSAPGLGSLRNAVQTAKQHRTLQQEQQQQRDAQQQAEPVQHQRARQYNPRSFLLTKAEAEVLVQLCARL